MIFENEIATFEGISVVLRTGDNLLDENEKNKFEVVSKYLKKILNQISLHEDYEDLLDARNKLNEICDLCCTKMADDAEKQQKLNSEMEFEPYF